MSNMVDSKLAKSVQKSVGRAKEKILQNLGKVDRTADEIFDEHVTNFSKQQCAATRLQKELNNYIRCIRACAGASRGLLEAVSEVYEPEWGGKELLTINSQTSEMLWNDFAHRLAEQVLIPLNTYQAQFPEMRKKIEKRGRKLVDYDGERHALQALQSNPRRAEAKLARQRESLESAKRTYEVLNSELHEELPSLYGSRIVFLVSAMSTLFASENIFHSEASKVFAELEGIVERLSKESAKGALNHSKAPSSAMINNTDSPKDDEKRIKGENGSGTSSQAPSNCINAKRNNVNTAETQNNAATTPTKSTVGSDKMTVGTDGDDGRWNNKSNGGTEGEHLYANVSNGLEKPTGKTENGQSMMGNKAIDKINGEDHARDEQADSTLPTPPLLTAQKHSAQNDAAADGEKVNESNNDKNIDSSLPSSPTTTSPVTKSPQDSNVSPTIPPKHGSNTSTPTTNGPTVQGNGLTDTNANPSSNTKSNTNNTTSSSTDKLPPGVLYRVRATYRYQKEDVDELSFEAGELISVVEYEDPEEQEEGWLMGVKENGEKGMFPANFTRPL